MPSPTRAAAPVGPGPRTSTAAIAALDRCPPCARAGPPYRLTAGAVAELSLVSAGAISQRVARAEREGLVRRERSGTDGRLSYVALTAAGHALIERSVDGLLRHEEALLAPLAEDQREDLAAQLKTLLAHLGPGLPARRSGRPGRRAGYAADPRATARACVTSGC